MPEPRKPSEESLQRLQERAKELDCLYRVEEVLGRPDAGLDAVLDGVVAAIPAGWQHGDLCRARIVLDDRVWSAPDFPETGDGLAADIVVEEQVAGRIEVRYAAGAPAAKEGPFLGGERRLLEAIAGRVALHLLQQKLRRAHQAFDATLIGAAPHDRPPLAVLLDFIRRTDANLLKRITRRMINFLAWTGVEDAQRMLREGYGSGGGDNENRPSRRRRMPAAADLTARAFEIAAANLNEAEIITAIQTWIKEEKSSFLIRTLENLDTNLGEIAEAVDRFQAATVDEGELPYAVRTSLKVSLIRRFFTDRLEFINVAKQHVQIKDFYVLARHLVYPSNSQGQLGGKGAGIFLADRILARQAGKLAGFDGVRVPRTWYVASDGVLDFMHHNDLDDLYNQKYEDIERVRQDYPHVIQVFKHSEFPPELEKGLAVALDDFEDRPLVVRSSSLLEDRAGSAFSGKYKSLFLANQGSKRQRLEALKDAIAEVYASIFGPDPIEYRADRGLLDFREEMGILIQEVVGQRFGDYFAPAFAGVGFSNNEFRWSPRIRREDGLLRLVPGLGTRAVDRLSDDYPVLISPGQPGLRVTVAPHEILRYSPRNIDVINLRTNRFETHDVMRLLRETGDEFPMVRQIVSMVEGDRVRRPVGLEPDFEKDDFAVTLQGLFTHTPFLAQMKTVLDVLRQELGTPVDIEFAHDGKALHLVQCRPQSYAAEDAPASIPHDIPAERRIFSAHRFISNGRVPDITHIVYVDPAGYGHLETQKDLADTARAVGRLNSLLPKRQFILIGPGRWGSRGDIKLGVGVTYSDINNTAVLLEVARAQGNYTPELSFGTHFFQDLVEAGIRYIPLYPDERENLFNEAFLARACNIFPELVPEYAHLAPTIRVVDVPREADGRILKILMNADLDEAVGFLTMPAPGERAGFAPAFIADMPAEEHWRWRLRMAERIAAQLDAGRFGVRALYVIGSTKNAVAGPRSDIDLLVHFAGTAEQKGELLAWLEGWSLSLAEVNYLRTGYRSEGLLDVHLVTDEDIRRQTDFGAKIGAVTDAARTLEMKKS